MSRTRMVLKRFRVSRSTQHVWIMRRAARGRPCSGLAALAQDAGAFPRQSGGRGRAGRHVGFRTGRGPVLSGVDGLRPLAFPADHGPHDDFQTEWWYYTGNLTAETGEHFGYQLTFFRRALTPPDQRSARDSAWAADQVYMAHLALTDVSGGKHYSFEKLAHGRGRPRGRAG